MSFPQYGNHGGHAQFPPTHIPQADFNMIAQSTHYPMTDGYTDIMTVDWLNSDPAMEILNQGEPLDATPSSRHDSEVTLVGSSEIISLLQDVKNSVDNLKKSVDDNKKSIDELNRRVSETQVELHLLQETSATLQKEIHLNSSALSNVDKYIEGHKEWTLDFRKGVEESLRGITDSSKSRK